MRLLARASLIFFFLIFIVAFSPNNSGRETPFKAYKEQLTGSDVTIDMLPVRGGKFLMGDNHGAKDESPAHEVEVEDFWMGTYEITWDQYLLFSEQRNDKVNKDRDDEISMEVDGIASATTPYVDMSHGMGKEGYPVINVTQHAALTFCKWLSAKTGRFYRLPTEAEWEYACRAGSTSAYSFGNDTTLLNKYAWSKNNSARKYHKVGLKEPNAYGLYDMHGNVAEWTMDQYAEDTYKTRAGRTSKNPWLIPKSLYPRTVRGGSWQDYAFALRSSARKGSEARWKRIDPQIPKSRWWFTNAPDVGFRIVRPRITPPQNEINKYWLEAIDDY